MYNTLISILACRGIVMTFQHAHDSLGMEPTGSTQYSFGVGMPPCYNWKPILSVATCKLTNTVICC